MLQKAEHIWQHVGHHGEVRIQPRGTGARTHQSADRGEEEDGCSAQPDAAKVSYWLTKRDTNLDVRNPTITIILEWKGQAIVVFFVQA